MRRVLSGAGWAGSARHGDALNPGGFYSGDLNADRLCDGLARRVGERRSEHSWLDTRPGDARCHDCRGGDAVDSFLHALVWGQYRGGWPARLSEIVWTAPG